MKKIISLTALLLVVVLSACNSVQTPLPEGSTTTPSAESQAVAEALVSELDTSADALTMTGVSLSRVNARANALGKL